MPKTKETGAVDIFSRDNSTKTTDKKRVKQLEKIITTLDTFYEEGNDCINPVTGQVVLDNEYDALKQELFKLCPASKIFKTVTSSRARPAKNKVIHKPPMTSINKCNGTQAEKEKILFKWFADGSVNGVLSSKKTTFIKKDNYKLSFPEDWFCLSYKRDGIAISLEYKKGELIKAGLRSKSGKDGIDVTDKTRHIGNIPWQLPIPFTGIIRGEVETHVSTFKKVSVELGDDAKANPRAHTAGTMNLKRPEDIHGRGLTFIAYEIIMDNPPFDTETGKAKWAKDVLKIDFVKTIPFEWDWLEIFEEQHRRLDFMVDGIVLTVNWICEQEKLGRTGNKDTGNPKWKLAWKFKDEIKIATIKDIIWQTGRTGNVTPVLIFDGIQLEGTTVTKCTAHNLGIIKQHRIGVGSVVEIIKSGKIIPKMHRVVKAIGFKLIGKASYPKNCPSCGGILNEVMGANNAQALNCDSPTCPAQNVKNLNHFLTILGVKGIAESTINKLVEAGMVQRRSDFYKLTLEYLLNNGFTERTSVLILARVWMIPDPEQEKDNKVLLKELGKITKITVPMSKFIASFGIEGSGKEVGRLLAKEYGDFDKIRNLSVKELSAIDGIGPITADSTKAFFYFNKKEVDQLLDFIDLEVPKKGGDLEGKKFVLSGALDGGKGKWRKAIEAKGGEVKSSVSRKVDYLVAGEGSGSKSDKAKELGVTIIATTELEKILNG